MDPFELVSSSSRWMWSAMAAFSRDDGSDDFVVHRLGVATEHLLKAYLVALHPVHIVDEKHWESLLYATGHGGRLGVLRSRTRTIGLKTAFDRVKKLIPKITITAQEFELVRAARDGVAHVGHHDTDEARAVLTTVVRLTVPVLAELGQLLDVKDWTADYWGPYRQLGNDLIDKHTTEVRLALTAKITRARDMSWDRLAGISSSQRMVLVETIGAHNPFNYVNVYVQRAESCEACEGRGWMRGPAEARFWPDGEGGIEGYVAFFPGSYYCAVCDLRLDAEEMKLLDLHTPIELVDEDPFNWLESDEDLHRTTANDLVHGWAGSLR